MEVEWRKIEEYPGYWVSSIGDVRRGERGISQVSHDSGYRRVNLRQGDQKRLKYVHRLVADAWIPNPERKMQVNHIDGDRANNSADNLEWVSAKENAGKKTKAYPARKGGARKVAQIALDGRVVKIWGSIKEASASVGANQTSITNCCREVKGYPTSGGYKWEYADEDDLADEVWGVASAADLMFDVSTRGRVRMLNGGATYGTDSQGYRKITRHGKHYAVHRLVAVAFLPCEDGKEVVNHKDGNKSNNNLENLEWVSWQENSQHCFDTGLRDKQRVMRIGEDCRVYDSVAAAAESVGLAGTNISACLDKPWRTAAGYRWIRMRQVPHHPIIMPSLTLSAVLDDDPVWAELGL